MRLSYGAQRCSGETFRPRRVSAAAEHAHSAARASTASPLRRAVRGGGVVTGPAISTACPPALGRVRGPAPVDSPWKSLRASARGPVPIGELGAVRPELLQCRPSHRTEPTPPRQPKHGISDTPRGGDGAAHVGRRDRATSRNLTHDEKPIPCRVLPRASPYGDGRGAARRDPRRSSGASRPRGVARRRPRPGGAGPRARTARLQVRVPVPSRLRRPVAGASVGLATAHPALKHTGPHATSNEDRSSIIPIAGAIPVAAVPAHSPTSRRVCPHAGSSGPR